MLSLKSQVKLMPVVLSNEISVGKLRRRQPAIMRIGISMKLKKSGSKPIKVIDIDTDLAVQNLLQICDAKEIKEDYKEFQNETAIEHKLSFNIRVDTLQAEILQVYITKIINIIHYTSFL
jgi:hypothetical protein